MKSFINPSTKIFGILGHPVSHSLSPLIHNTAFHLQNFNGVYLAFDIEKPDLKTKESFFELGIQGLSVTIPHKKWACSIADSRDSLSEICQASNTLIKTSNHKFSAYNTDGPGALNAIHTKMNSLKNKKVLLLGYGGSALAISHSMILKDSPAMIYIGGRNQEKISEFIKTFDVHDNLSTKIAASGKDLDPEDVDLIINTTPLGMSHADETLPLDEDFIQSRHTVFDIVYVPHETPLIQAAKKRNADIVYGYLMLLYQAVLQYELFTGQKAPVDVMDGLLKEALNIKLS
ncbi:MAG: shikimate dehydrogenase [Spirochaetia bacterium]|nr:shikimate dehydrogenase [Spirochaetia bacterium]